MVLAAGTAWSLLVSGYGLCVRCRTPRVVNEAMERRTLLDAGTGVFNSRYLDMRLAEHEDLARRHGDFVSVLWVNLDGFGKVNAGHGYQAGDVVLRTLAGTMARQLRSCDVFGRIGGDDFLAVLPQTDRRQAHIPAERLRVSVEECVCQAEGGKVVDSLHVSIGVAAYPVNGETMHDVVQAAGRALRQAKDAGGNTVVSAEDFIHSDSRADAIIRKVRSQPNA